MQKKIIALAIASALTAPALAFADATVYGQANLSIDRVNDGASPSASTWQLNSNSSRLGVKGSEDLGNGLSAIAQLEGSIVMDSAGTASLAFNRDTFLGLSSATAGTLVLGQHDTPYKMSTRRLDMFADGIADNRGNQSTSPTFGGTAMMGAGHDVRPGNVIAYISPSMSGFSVAAAGLFGAESAAANTSKGSGYSLAGMYDQGPFYATLAYDNFKSGDCSTGDLAGVCVIDNTTTPPTLISSTSGGQSKAFKLGGSYSMDAFAINAVVEQIKETLNGVEAKNTNYYLAGKFNISSTDAVKLAYTRRGTQTNLSNEAKQYTVGYDHSLSNSTSVYALYTKLTDNGTHTVFDTTTFPPTATGTAGNSDPSALSVGIKHSF